MLQGFVLVFMKSQNMCFGLRNTFRTLLLPFQSGKVYFHPVQNIPVTEKRCDFPLEVTVNTLC